MQVGRYQIVAEIARGGAGAVYQARDTSMGRDVAIKVLRNRHWSHPRELQRFAREAEVYGKLRHPHIVSVHDAGEHQGVPYLVMDWVQGESLQDRIDREQSLDPEIAAGLILPIARALQHAHDQGVFHRDVKPDNVLLTRGGTPLLTDFGLAKTLDLSAEKLSRTGAFLGTPGYSPPEQALGSSSQVGPPADVYAVGATLYAALTGVPPVRGGSLIEMVIATQAMTPVAPSEVSPHVPRALDRICLRCLEKDPADRYGSAAELVDELERYLRGEGSKTRGLQLGGAALVLVAVVVALVVALGRGSSEVPQEQLSEQTPAVEPASDPRPKTSPKYRADLARAEAGEGWAMLAVAKALDSGRGVPQDRPAASAWLLRAAQAGETDALYLLLQEGRPIKGAELEGAIGLLKPLASAQDARASEALGLIYLGGRGVERDLRQAMALLERASQAGRLRATCKLGVLYRTGTDGLESNLDTAEGYFRRAANAGHPRGMTLLGALLLERETPADKTDGRRLLRSGAAAGDPDAKFRLGKDAEARSRVEDSHRWYEAAARDGHTAAMVTLGLALRSATPEQALKWFQKAAEAGDVAGMRHLAWMHENGQGTRRNLAQALHWYRRAAETHPENARWLAAHYERGGPLVGKADLAVALTWYRRSLGMGVEGQAQELVDGVLTRLARKQYRNAAAILQIPAEAGHLGAMTELANLHREGLGVPKSDEQAVRWLRKAAGKDHPPALRLLAWHQEQGRGIERSPTAAATQYRRAADLGDARAAVLLGHLDQRGEGVGRSDAQAVHWFKRAAETKDTAAMIALGHACRTGRGVAKSDEQAFRWLFDAAQLGDPAGMSGLGRLYELGAGVEHSLPDAVRYYERAAQRLDPAGQYYLGLLCRDGRGVALDRKRSTLLLIQAAEAGHTGAMNELGAGSRDQSEATRWYRRSAEAGDAVGMANLGLAYHHARGVEQSYEVARTWYMRAARLGDSSAMHNLGVLYVDGKGVRKDRAEGRAWYRRAAEKNNAHSMENLGLQLITIKRRDEGLSWLRKAVQAGRGSSRLHVAAELTARLVEQRGFTISHRGKAHGSAFRRLLESMYPAHSAEIVRCMVPYQTGAALALERRGGGASITLMLMASPADCLRFRDLERKLLKIREQTVQGSTTRVLSLDLQEVRERDVVGLYVNKTVRVTGVAGTIPTQQLFVTTGPLMIDIVWTRLPGARAELLALARSVVATWVESGKN